MKFFYVLALLCNLLVIGGLTLCLYVGNACPALMPELRIGSVIVAAVVGAICVMLLYGQVMSYEDAVTEANIVLEQCSKKLTTSFPCKTKHPMLLQPYPGPDKCAATPMSLKPSDIGPKPFYGPAAPYDFDALTCCPVLPAFKSKA